MSTEVTPKNSASHLDRDVEAGNERDVEAGSTAPTVGAGSKEAEPTHTMPTANVFTKEDGPTSTVQTDEEKQTPSTEEKEEKDPNIVDWDGDSDPQNPMNWTTGRKWFVIILISAITFNVSMASTSFAPGVPAVQAEFHNTDGSIASLLVSIYIIGIAIGPLILSPLSEYWGRLIMINTANVFFFIATIVSAVSVNIPMLIIFRLIMGMGCSVPVTTGGGVIADLIEPEKRGTALALWTFGPLLGPVIGPVMGGYVSLKLTWRWTFWIVAILETYAPRIIQLKTERLRKETGNTQLRSKYDKGLSPNKTLQQALIRTAKIILRSPIVMTLTLFVSVMYSYLYLLFTTLTPIFEDQYGFNTGEAGLTYLGIGIGFLIGQGTLGWFSDFHLARVKAAKGKVAPEDRLPPVAVGAFLFPLGLFWYGWTIEYHVHWIVPIVGSGLVGLCIIYVFFPVQLYLVDSYGIYAVSAIAANVAVRSVFATVIPLAGPALYGRLGLGWGSTLLGFLALLFAPCSLALLKYGEYIRTHPRFQLNL